ncbi:MAG TPA: type II toxin-antitoxin system RelE/ParE family toxin [Hyphomicrobiaceae bacterium]|nr:type II toxin-antitoxin system RelE/ParE family toxin [Hyphomicrobiaceae bacterium]
MRVHFVSHARAEILEATAYYRDQSSEVARRFLADLASATSLLLQFPGIGSPAQGGVRRFLLKAFPYQLIYRVDGNDIRVFAVAHVKRRPGYWRDRLR